MTRLTKQSNLVYRFDDSVSKYIAIKPIFIKDDDSLMALCKIIAKLGQLEDIEEELGIDLITLFEILKSENIYANGKRYDNSNSLSYMGNSWLIFNHQAKQGFRFKDYGKTWALTKEELK